MSPESFHPLDSSDFGIPSDRGVFILVRGERTIVARYRRTGPRETYTVQPAANWEALEPAAQDAVEAVGGAFWADDHYPCPPALATQARFTD